MLDELKCNEKCKYPETYDGRRFLDKRLKSYLTGLILSQSNIRIGSIHYLFPGLGYNFMRLFFIDPSAASEPTVAIEGSEAHHIKNVLRLKPGDPIKLFDGTGHEYVAVIAAVHAEKVEAKIRHRTRSNINPGARIVVAQAFLKEKKMDDLVRKLSELGIAEWIPFFSERSVARPDKERLANRTRRWKRIATEAMKQCRRKTMLEVSEAQTFDNILELGESADLKIVFWENENTPLSRETGLNSKSPWKSIMVMLGPEGGFTRREIEMARQSGFFTAGLGPRILRAETATLAASTLVQYLFGDIGPKLFEPKQDF
jgi:16S rRNA (uracil1498-N3)-methyltransferase